MDKGLTWIDARWPGDQVGQSLKGPIVQIVREKTLRRLGPGRSRHRCNALSVAVWILNDRVTQFTLRFGITLESCRCHTAPWIGPMVCQGVGAMLAHFES